MTMSRREAELLLLSIDSTPLTFAGGLELEIVMGVSIINGIGFNSDGCWTGQDAARERSDSRLINGCRLVLEGGGFTAWGLLLRVGWLVVQWDGTLLVGGS